MSRTLVIVNPAAHSERAKRKRSQVESLARDCVVCTTTCTGDRKSTRLNSSHGYISYAVFCLKQKTVRVSGPSREYGGILRIGQSLRASSARHTDMRSSLVTTMHYPCSTH